MPQIIHERISEQAIFLDDSFAPVTSSIRHTVTVTLREENSETGTFSRLGAANINVFAVPSYDLGNLAGLHFNGRSLSCIAEFREYGQRLTFCKELIDNMRGYPCTLIDSKLSLVDIQLALSSGRLLSYLFQGKVRQNGNPQSNRNPRYLQKSLSVSPQVGAWMLAGTGFVIFGCFYWKIRDGNCGRNGWLYFLGFIVGLLIYTIGLSKAINEELKSSERATDKFEYVALFDPPHDRGNIAHFDLDSIGKNKARNA